MCDERFAVEGLVSSQNKYADDVPHGCMAVLAIWILSTSNGDSSFAVNYSAVFLGMMPAYLLSYDHASVGWTEYSFAAAAEQGDFRWQKNISWVCFARRSLRLL